MRALTIEYHGIARSELEAAKKVAESGGVIEHRFVSLPDLMEAGDMHSGAFAGMPPTYIPMKNSIFYSHAAAYAEETGAEVLVGGHNRDDGRIFPDARRAFFAQLGKALRAGSPELKSRRTRIVLPLSRMSKAEVIWIASSQGVPLHLTWSCYRDGRTHCWDCDGCAARSAAFSNAGVRDPLNASPVGGKFLKQ